MKKQRSIKGLFTKRESLLLCFLLFFLLFTKESEAQWRKLHQFPDRVNVIYFPDFDTTHQLCFVGIKGGQDDPNKILKSTNAGIDWIVCPSGKNKFGTYGQVGGFWFKDSLIGWHWGFITELPPGDYKTTDGGNTWNIMPTLGTCFSMAYVPSTKRLIGGTSTTPPTGGLCPYTYSLDEGNTFTLGPLITDFQVGVGITFSDDLHGIITSICATPANKGILYTADGGISWQQSFPFNNADQPDPLGIKGTQTFFVITALDCEPNNKVQNDVLRSDDGGVTWRNLYTYFSHTQEKWVTGSIKKGRGTTLFFQTSTDSTEGIMMSEDTGHTFHSICGPNNTSYTRFAVNDTVIYAADLTGGLWINTTGIGSFSSPQLSATTFQLSGCGIKDTVLLMTFFDSCSDYQGKLIWATLDRTSNFSIQRPFDRARTLHSNDSLVIHYDPNLSLSDTAHLHLRFHLGFKDFDTTLLLVGSAQNEIEQVRFVPTLSEPMTSPGKTTDIIIKPDKLIQGKGLNSLSFHLQYNGDLLTNIAVKTSLPSGTQIIKGNETRAGKITTLPITITGNDLPLDPAQAVATITMQTSVTDTLTTDLSLSNLELNNGDPAFANCVLSVDTSSTQFTLALNCSDTILYHYLKTKQILGITSIIPNPASNKVSVEFYSAEKTDVQIQLIDALGNEVKSLTTTAAIGSNKLTLTMPDQAGVYHLRLSTPRQTVTEKVIKQ